MLQQELRPLLVRMVHITNVLEPWTRWLSWFWYGLPFKVRKTWSHYGALVMNEVPFSGRDPSNRHWAWCFHLLADFTVEATCELWPCNAETLGDIMEGVLGYWWWLRYRGGRGIANEAEFLELLFNDWPDWRRPDWLTPLSRHLMWQVWRQQFQLGWVAELIEELTMSCEALERRRPDLFTDGLEPRECSSRFDELRVGRIP